MIATILISLSLLSPATTLSTTQQQAPRWSCSQYTDWNAANDAWNAQGRPSVADRDKDGIPCETLPGAPGKPAKKPKTKGCMLTEETVLVNLSVSQYPLTIQHAQDAIAAGKPTILHLDRKNAAKNRKDDLKGIPTKKGHDRDEYPPAVSMESAGGSADVRYVPSKDNRGAGSSMGLQLRKYCDGQAFQYNFTE